MKSNNDGFTTNQCLFALLVLAFTLLAGFALGYHYGSPRAVPAQKATAQVALKDGALGAANSGSAGKAPLAITPIEAGTKPVATGDFHFHTSVSWTPAPPAVSGQPAPTVESAPPAVPLDCKPFFQDYMQHLSCDGTVRETFVKNSQGQVHMDVQGVGGTVVDQASFNAGALDKGLPARHPLGIGVAYPLGLPGSQMGVAVSYDFNLLPVTAGADAYTQNGRLAGMATVVWHLRGF